VNYRFAALAETDLLRLAKDGSERFGAAQSSRYLSGIKGAFELIAEFPHSNREREGYRGHCRVGRYGAHVIVYRIEIDGIVTILRVRHGREDWLGEL